MRLEPEVWQQGGVGPEGAPGRKVKKVFRLEEKSGEEGKKKAGSELSVGLESKHGIRHVMR